MSILDELRKEAEAVAAERERETTAVRAAQEQAKARIQPLMQSLFKYFSELKQHLMVVNKEITTSYEIRDVGLVDALSQGQYGVATDRVEQIDKFSFRCVCSRSGVLQVNQADTAAASAYRDYLRDNGLQAKVRDMGRGQSLFMVQPSIPVVVEFSADYARAAIVLRLRNLNAIGVTRHTLALDVVDEKFMDELAKALLRVPNRFEELIGASLSDTTKVKLKKKIRAAMRQKQIQDELELARAERSESITQRFGRSLFGRGKR